MLTRSAKAFSIGVTALGATFTSQGMEFFNKLLPVFAFIGYLFPTR